MRSSNFFLALPVSEFKLNVYTPFSFWGSIEDIVFWVFFVGHCAHCAVLHLLLWMVMLTWHGCDTFCFPERLSASAWSVGSTGRTKSTQTNNLRSSFCTTTPYKPSRTTWKQNLFCTIPMSVFLPVLPFLNVFLVVFFFSLFIFYIVVCSKFCSCS